MIIYSTNPLRPAETKKTHEIYESCDVQKIFNDLDLGSSIVYINGREVNENSMVTPEDHVLIIPIMQGGGGGTGDTKRVIGAVLAIAGAVVIGLFGWTGVGAQIGVGLISTGIGLYMAGDQINKLEKQGGNDAGAFESQPSMALSISSSGNQARTGSQLPLILGESIRVFPDHGMQPYVEYVEQATTTTEGLVQKDLSYIFCVNGSSNSKSVTKKPSFQNVYFGYGYVESCYNYSDYETGSPTNTSEMNITSQPIPFQNLWIDVTSSFTKNLTANIILTKPASSAIDTPSVDPKLYDTTVDIPANLKVFQDKIAWYHIGTAPASNTYTATFTDPIGQVSTQTLSVCYYVYNTVSGLRSMLLTKDEAKSVLDQTLASQPTSGPYITKTNLINPESSSSVVYGYMSKHFVRFNRFGFTHTPRYINQVITLVKNKQQLNQIFNFGFGDLTYSDFRVENTEVSKFREFEFYYPTQVQTSWYIDAPVDRPWSHVDTTKGQKLVNNSDFSDYVYRETPVDTYRIDFDLVGRLYSIDGNGQTGLNAVTIIAQYRNLLPTVGAWTNVFISPTFDIQNNSLDLVKRTFSIGQNTALTPSKYELRIKKTTADQDQRTLISDIEFGDMRSYRLDNAKFVGQNRIGITTLATEQFNGTIGKFNCNVTPKCWVWDGSTWSWTSSGNPAWWYLYYLRGSFRNPTNNLLSTYPNSPTIGWTNSALNSTNENRLFGCGILDTEIDIEEIKQWATFCAAQNLKISGSIFENKNCFDVLNMIASCGRGSPSFSNGKFGVIWESANESITAIFGPHNIIKDSFSISYSSERVPEEIQMTFPDKNNYYEQKMISVTRPDLVSYPKITVKIPLWGITEASRAQREANLLISRQLYQRRTITFKVSAEGNMLRRGDVVGLTHDITQWAYSFRPWKIEIENGKLSKIYLDNDNLPLTHTKIALRIPNGTLKYITCIQVSSKELLVTSDADVFDYELPQYIDQDLTQNLSSGFSDSVCEDLLLLIDNVATSGKKCRVTRVDPNNDETFSVTCMDEEDVIWSNEYGLTNNLPQLYDAIEAKIINGNIEKLENNKLKIYWENLNCDGASVLYSINNSPFIPFYISGSTNIYSNEITTDSFTSGQFVKFRLIPLLSGTPHTSTNLDLEVTI